MSDQGANGIISVRLITSDLLIILTAAIVSVCANVLGNDSDGVRTRDSHVVHCVKPISCSCKHVGVAEVNES